MNTLLKRIEREVFELIAPEFARHHGKINYDDDEGTWVSISRVPVPQRLTPNGDGFASILLLVPRTYPQVPPDGFYCDQGLRINNHYFLGFRDKYYPELQTTLIEQGWQWFCAHASHNRSVSGWRVTSDPHQGDNLLKYLRLCLAILGKESIKNQDRDRWRSRVQRQMNEMEEDDLPPWLRRANRQDNG